MLQHRYEVLKGCNLWNFMSIIKLYNIFILRMSDPAFVFTCGGSTQVNGSQLSSFSNHWLHLSKWEQNLIKLDQTWPNLTKLDQTWPNLIKLDQTWSNLIKLDQTWSNLTKLDQTWPNLIKLDKTDKTCSN